MEQTVLHTQDLRIGYASKKAENVIAFDINVSLRKGKLIALVGANGIGKSTLLRTITGIQKPLSGTVLLNNRSIHEQTAAQVATALSVVLTEKLPPSNLTVFELVALGRQPYTNWIGKLTEEDHSKIQQAIGLAQITSLVHKKHYEISDGQLQKVLIARALAQDTPLIILDEPTTHLDLLHKVSLFRLLKKLTQETQKCILFSTHDIDLALQLSDEIVVMTADKTVQDIPSKLIADGVFDQLFKDEHIVFDVEKGKFVFKNL
ncbi:ABC transporter ATP-binding protein [Flavobacterium sp.]|uniref:ABC transporter ATP-binding protein n=1 Tax=Flavobacterium sp. TaxID=239 RepID=UPI0039E4D755